MHPAIVKARAPGVYDGWIAKSIHLFKYDRERDRAAHLAEMMLSAFADLDAVDVIIPVPLHPKRQEVRGFNQAEALAKHLGEFTGIPVEVALVRLRETEIQAQMSREDRLANVNGAFALNPGWTLKRGTHYALVDDVYTTGATLGACAEVLDAAGATTISVVTLTFDLQKRDLAIYRDRVRSISS